MREKTTSARLGKFDGSLRVVRSYDAHKEVKVRVGACSKTKRRRKNGVRQYHLSADVFTATALSYVIQKKGVYQVELAMISKKKTSKVKVFVKLRSCAMFCKPHPSHENRQCL
jgi:hypothetical protein